MNNDVINQSSDEMFSMCHMLCCSLCTLFSQIDELKQIHKRNMGDCQKADLTTVVIFVAHDMFTVRLIIIALHFYEKIPEGLNSFPSIFLALWELCLSLTAPFYI